MKIIRKMRDKLSSIFLEIYKDYKDFKSKEYEKMRLKRENYEYEDYKGIFRFLKIFEEEREVINYKDNKAKFIAGKLTDAFAIICFLISLFIVGCVLAVILKIIFIVLMAVAPELFSLILKGLSLLKDFGDSEYFLPVTIYGGYFVVGYVCMGFVGFEQGEKEEYSILSNVCLGILILQAIAFLIWLGYYVWMFLKWLFS